MPPAMKSTAATSGSRTLSGQLLQNPATLRAVFSTGVPALPSKPLPNERPCRLF